MSRGKAGVCSTSANIFLIMSGMILFLSCTLGLAGKPCCTRGLYRGGVNGRGRGIWGAAQLLEESLLSVFSSICFSSPQVAFRLDFEFSKSIFLQSMEIYLTANRLMTTLFFCSPFCVCVCVCLSPPLSNSTRHCLHASHLLEPVLSPPCCSLIGDGFHLLPLSAIAACGF